jgi:hypothetical protein
MAQRHRRRAAWNAPVDRAMTLWLAIVFVADTAADADTGLDTLCAVRLKWFQMSQSY